MPKLSVLIHTHNDAEHLPRVLDSLKSCCSDVLVVDEGSDDETQRVARKGEGCDPRCQRWRFCHGFAA